MTISNFGELKTAVKDWMERSSLTDAIVADFITIAQSKLHHGAPGGIEPLRISAMETETDLTVNARTVALPTGHLATKRLYLDTSPKQFLRLISPEKLWSTLAGTYTGRPLAYAVEDENYVFGPAPDSSYTGKCLYIKSFTAFSLDADTDWVLSNAPHVYLYGALAEGFQYIMDGEKAVSYQGQFADAITRLNADDDNKQYSGAAWSVLADHGHP